MSHSGRRGRLLLNASPVCNLCGESIYSFSTGISEIINRNAPKGVSLFSLHNRWIDGRPTDLDEIHFDEMWTCSGTFRVPLGMVAVYFNPFDTFDPEGTFHLSGVGELRPGQTTCLPQDDNQMILWNYQSPTQHALPTPKFLSVLSNLLTFPMHERCWRLMTQILDVELIKKNMDIFVRAMCQPWLLTRPVSNSSRSYPVVELSKLCVNLPRRFRLTPTLFRGMGDEDLSHMPRDFRGADPLNDSYVDKVIAKYAAKYTKKREKGFEPTWQPSIPTHTMSRRSQGTFRPRNVFLPTELILNIADYLGHHKDIQNLLSVFPHWHPMIPDTYWRRRFIDDNCLNNIQFPSEALDWQHLYLNCDRLLRPSLGWRNRQRILSQLQGTKERFLRQLEQKGK
ncbi:hypothetical protein N7519_003111 [Penicillium mononematosum]|uniref:uncharacterized protein n=1 Tax=Penicillium mononematosum TaxID=268346 RepID=UPI002549B504|nr:uncharacterized protein N7519_003111 [Penicillium mononematosum]KAJ6188203.1 hypothetical protein N7519_003111 [Penicillium mononematosum]